VVDIEEGSLSAFEEHVLAGSQGAIEDPTGVIDVGLKLSPEFNTLFIEFADVDGVGAMQLREFEVLLFADGFEFGAKRVGLAKVGDADATAGDLVFVTRADAAPRRADLGLTGRPFTGDVEGAMPDENDVCATGDAQTRGILQDATGLERFDFLEQDCGIDDDAGTDQVDGSRVEDAGGNYVEDRRFAIHDQRVAGVVAALEPGHEIRTRTEPIYDLAFAFIAPLGAYTDYGCHCSFAPIFSSISWPFLA
jgi:hypothetical protein